MGDDGVEDDPGHLALVGQRYILLVAGGVEKNHPVGVMLEAGAGCRHVIRHQQVETLPPQLGPRLVASSARACPCLPEERLPTKRTGSIGSRVPPAVTSTRTPRRSFGPRTRATAATMSSGSANRPAPASPPARRPTTGSTRVTPR